jgi:predicted nucleic acid-binding protein
LLARTGREAALGFLRAVRESPNEVVTSTPDVEDRAAYWLERNPFEAYGDVYSFSLVDAVSFEVMKTRGIREVLTLNQHFTFLWPEA